MQDTLRNAIKTLSEKYEIEPLKFRINISKPKGDLKYHIMSYNKIVSETNLASALNLNTLKAFMAGVKLSSVFNKLSSDNQVEKSKMNVKIYTKSEDYTPLIYLFDGETPKRKVELSEFD